jgi:hypothetical protein
MWGSGLVVGMVLAAAAAPPGPAALQLRPPVLALAPAAPARPSLAVPPLELAAPELIPPPTSPPLELAAHDRPEQALEPHVPRAHPLLAVMWTAIAMAGGAVWYYRDFNFNSVDFDYNWSRATWEKKLVTFQAVRFDDNQFPTNMFWHPIDATGIYLIGRGNGLGPVPSFLMAVVESTIWEFLVEYREVAAINDLIVTPMAGISFGEPIFRTSALLTAADPGPIASGIGAVMNPFGSINSIFESGHRRGGAVANRWGLPADYPYRLELALGGGVANFSNGASRNELELYGDGLIAAMPDLPEPGRRSDLVGIGTLTGATGRGALADDRIVEANVATGVSLIGQLIRWAEGVDDMFVTSQQRFFWGAATGFEYTMRDRPGIPEDLIGIVKVAGPKLDYELRRGDFHLHGIADAYYDFALVSSFALDRYIAQFGTLALPNVMTQKHYYYAQGGSASLRLIADLGPWEGGAYAEADRFYWIHGHDRYNPLLPEPPASDGRTTAQLWAGVRPFARQPLKLSVVGTRITRDGSLPDSYLRIAEYRLSTLFGFSF